MFGVRRLVTRTMNGRDRGVHELQQTIKCAEEVPAEDGDGRLAGVGEVAGIMELLQLLHESTLASLV